MQIVKEEDRHSPTFVVRQGSATLGKFWYANQTIYAYPANAPKPIGTDIGLQEQVDVARWVSEAYFKNIKEGSE